MDRDLPFGAWLRGLRQTLDLGQADLAQELGCSTITIRKLESGDRRPSSRLAERLAERFGLKDSERAAFLALARGDVAGEPGLSAPSPAPSSAGGLSEAPRSNLVVPRTALIGRHAEIELIQSQLRTSEGRLITLVGTGGIGKTRLALAAAAAVDDVYTDGVWLVELASIAEPALVAPAIAQTLQLHDDGGAGAEDRLRQFLCDKRLLLVLDNFEQVVEAAPGVANLLDAAPRLSVLVTSRSPLRLRGEQVIDVPPLRLPPAGEQADDVERVGQYEAVQCFVARAQAVSADFALTPSNVRAVAELCVQLDGLPLALELAAARIALLSPQDMLRRLGPNGSLRLRLLTGGARDLPARQRTLRATIEWSLSLLDAGKQRLFARLAVFNGGCTIDAVEAICGDGELDIIEALQALLDSSLMRQAPGHSTAQGAAQRRITMLETIRELALEQLQALDEADAVRERHAGYFLALAETAEVELNSLDQHRWLARLEQEYDNLRAALEWCLAAQGPGHLEIALRMATALTAFWKIRGYPGEGRGWWERLLAVKHMPNTLRTRALIGAGTMAWMLADFARATELHGEALELSRRLGDKHGVAAASNHLGAQAMEQGELLRALPLLKESIALRRELDDVPGMIETLNNLGVIAEHKGDYPRAALNYEESLALSRASGNQWMIALLLANLGEVAQHEGEYRRASLLYEEGFAVARSLDSRPLCAALLHKMGNLATLEGAPWHAVGKLQEGLALWRELGNAVGVVTCLEGLAAALAAGPRHTVERARGAVWLWAAAEARREAIHSHRPLADTLLYTPFLRAARTYLGEDAYALARETGRAMPLEQAIGYAQGLVLSPPESASSTASTSREALASLSERELDVLRLVASGLPDRAVAAKLIVSPRTVHTHLASIYGKLGINSRHAATLFAIENRLVASAD